MGTMKRALSLLVCALMVLSLCTGALGEGTIYENFQNPDARAKGMFRYWIPYAVEDNGEIEKQMTDLYARGFGGVEVAFFPSGYAYDNTVYGWAGENWRATMKRILKTAAGFEDGFIVDFTISPGWPLAINTIDPNDEAADMKLVAACAKLTELGSTVEMPMADIAVKDTFDDPFIIKNELVAAVVGKVVSVGEDGATVLDPATIKVVPANETDVVTPAGIPAVDEASADSEYILGLYEGEAPDTSIFFTDSVGKPVDIRTPLKDEQHYWTADLSGLDLGEYAPSEGEAIAEGDYVLYGFYRRGTGATTRVMGKYGIMEDALPGVMYETSPISAVSSEAIVAFMDEYLFCDDELVELMKQAHATVGGAIFEDSLENAYAGGVVWTTAMPETFEVETGYAIEAALPFISGVATASDGSEAAIKKDFNTVVSHMYQANHVALLQSYFNEKAGFDYRAQAYLTNPAFELDLSATSAQVDVAEGESLAFGVNYDTFRLVSGGVHIAGKTLVSDEAFALQEGTVYNMPWSVVLNTMNGNYAAGVNRVIFHGASYSGSDGATADVQPLTAAWPGWHAFDMVCTDAWDGRMPYWEDIELLSGYIARNQAVLQNGTPDMDLLVYDIHSYDYSTRGRTGDNSAFTALLDAGYTYDCVMTDGLALTADAVTDGVLCADGPSYRAVVVNHADEIAQPAIDELSVFAGAGVKVVLVGAVQDEAIAQSENVVIVGSADDVKAALEAFGVAPNASYAQPGLRNIMRKDDSGSYYFFYNDNDAPVSVPVTIAGSGTPCVLNAWNGEAATPAGCEIVEGAVSFTLKLDARATAIVAVGSGEAFPVAIEKTAMDETEAAEPVALDTWKLTIESIGPDASTEAQGDSMKTVIEIGETALCSWDALEVTEEQLTEAGVPGMENVAGIGYYETEVTVGACDGAVLTLEHGFDMVTAIEVNGVAVTGFDPAGSRFDLGSALKEGSNTIKVKLATTLFNRVFVENAMFGGQALGTYGITNAALEPYTIVK